LVVITRGADGAYFNCASGNQTISGEVPGFPVQAIDTLGAGDAFVAGLLWQVLQHRILNGLLNEPALQEIVRFANACGAIATRTAAPSPHCQRNRTFRSSCKHTPSKKSHREYSNTCGCAKLND
jgi:sugar/nucleoside kinase (ribokinase family)